MRNLAFLLCLFTVFSCSNFLSDEELKMRYDDALKGKDWQSVILLLDQIIERNPNHQDAYFSRAIARTNATPNNLDDIINDLSKHLEIHPSDEKGIYIRFQALAMDKQYIKALDDISELIKLKGKNPFLLSWKANCAFAAKKFKIAEKTYEERLRLRGSYEDLKNNYYYWIFSKYFGGNKEGASWDCAFLPDRGFKEDNELMKLISEDKLVFEEISNFQIPSFTLEQLETLLNNNCSDLDIFQGKNYFRSELMEQFARVESTVDLKPLLANKEEVYALSLRYTDIVELPKEIFQFINLQALNISGNRFKNKEKLIEDLSKLPNLRILVAYRCNLRSLPDNIELLQNLEVLSIGANGFKEINENIGSLKKIKLLDLGSNGRLKDLPESIGDLRCLERLDVSGSGLEKLREELSFCSELKSISANACKIQTLPQNIGNLVNLKHLNLGSNKIEKLPKSFGELPSLEHLSLGANDIKELPKSFSNLEKLNFCGLAYNRFKTFPDQVLGLVNVQNLWLHNNSFVSIPKEVASLPKLTHLLIDHQVISDKNIALLKNENSELRVIKEDTRKYVKGPKRKY